MASNTDEGPALSAVVADDAPAINLDVAQQEKLHGKQKPVHALTPPTSEDMNKHDDGSSELSDLDMEDEDDIGDIEPDHYFEGGKIPVFKPTMDQFRSFSRFIDKIDKYGMKSGIVKVIPPQEWRDALPDLSEAVKAIKVKNPIMQEFAGTHGTYTQANIEKQRSYNLPQWKALTQESSHQPPARRGERRRQAPEATPRPRPTRAQPTSPAPPTEQPLKRKRGRPPKAKPQPVKKEEAAEPAVDGTPHVPPTPTSPEARLEVASVTTPRDDREDVTFETPNSEKKKARGRPPKSKSVTSRRMNNRSEAQEYIDEEAFKNFNYKLETVDEYTIERCRELEEVYWKTVNYGTPMYGADMPGSLFEDKTTSWNVAHLENLLDVLGTKVPGVNTTYLYLGMWKATFAWHLEDVDLYSINYIHFGAPKQWYSISQEDARRFENAMKQLWPQDAKHCDQFLRHKTYLVSPDKLKSQFNITVNKLVHYEGEFVITYPYGYHSGFNLGYNCAESVNFATEPWLNYGRIAKKCYCEADSVWVNVNEIERKLRGEPTPEYYEETDDDGDEDEIEQVPTPPASHKGRPKTQSRKRKRDEKGTKDAGRKVKRIKVRIRLPGQEPCVLCPNDVPFDVLLPTDTGKRAHRLCAQYTPETYIKEENGKDMVFGVANINKDRLTLKCNFCRQKRVSFQCDSRKCTRGYHATCAYAAGVLVDFGPMPHYIDGVEYISEGFDFRCRFHRPKRDKKIDMDALEANSSNKSYGRNLQKGQVVQVMFLGGEAFGGLVVSNRPQESAVLIDVLPDGDRIEVEWKYLLVPDPDQSLRLKPTKDALPLPEHLLVANMDTSKTSRKSGNPEADEAFCDADAIYKWAEFHTCAMAECRNPHQAKVDLEKPEQIWHYLGKTSTEARAQYTHDPAKKIYNPNSNFLDSVKPPPAPLPPALDRRTSYGQSSQSSSAHYSSLFPGRPKYPVYRPQQPLLPQPPSDKPYQYKPKPEVKPRPYGYKAPAYSYGEQVHQWLDQAQQATGQRPQTASSEAGANAASGTAGDALPAQHDPATKQSAPAQNPVHLSSAEQTNEPNFIHSYLSRIGDQSQKGGKLDNSPPYPNYYEKIQRRYSLEQPMEHQYASLAGSASTHPRIAPAGRPRSSVEPSIDHLRKYEQYPYLRNSYLRRPKVYISPYEPVTNGRPRFSIEWQDHMKNVNAGYQPPLAAQPSLGSPRQSSPVAQHGLKPQYQTPQQFQQEVSKEGSRDAYGGSSSMKQLQQLMHQLSQSGQHNEAPHTPAAQAVDSNAILNGQPYKSSTAPGPSAAPTANMHFPMGHISNSKLTPPSGTPKGKHTSPVRPEYSPLSDAGTPKQKASSQHKKSRPSSAKGHEQHPPVMRAIAPAPAVRKSNE